MFIRKRCFLLLFFFLASCGFNDEKSLSEWVEEASRDQLLEYIKKNGMEVTDDHGATLLHLSIYRGREDLANILIDKGADLNVLDDFLEQPPLFSAVNQSDAIFKKLLENGANPNLSRKGGTTSLMRVPRSGHLEKAKLLLKYGADLSPTDSRGDTALLTAVRASHEKIAGFLVQQGADVNKNNNNGNSIFTYIARNKDPATLREVCSAKNDRISDLVFTAGLKELQCILRGAKAIALFPHHRSRATPTQPGCQRTAESSSKTSDTGNRDH